MHKYKPKKWFIYTRLIVLFLVIFTFGRTTNVVYSAIESKNYNEEKKLSQNVMIENKQDIYLEENPVLTKYLNMPEKGFEVTNNNKTYEISEEDYNLFIAVVASESHSNKDDILAVLSVILNRSDNADMNPVDIIKRPGQFSGYLQGHYLKYLNEDGSLKSNTELVQEVSKDALNGVRNCTYTGFRSWYMESYSDNYIAYKGNRFK
mgnify:CR=1 FL=1